MPPCQLSNSGILFYNANLVPPKEGECAES